MATVTTPPTRTDEQIASAPTVPLAAAPTALVGAPPPTGPFLALVIPHEEGERQAIAMETWFQACAADEPFALELIGTRLEQGFVLRASSEQQLILLSKQFEAQYPQAEIHPMAAWADPLTIRPDEMAVVGEFRLARPAWMPLKTFSGKALAEPGSDPLMGILAAMEPLGSKQRLICQLALVRAPDKWIAPDIRKAVEHPLQGERDAQVAAHRSIRAASDETEGARFAAAIIGLLLLILAYRWYEAQAWLPLTLLCLGLVAAGVGWLWWKLTHSRNPIYDMKLVSEKLMRQAFYCQLRVVAVGTFPVLAKEERARRDLLDPRERGKVERAEQDRLEQQLRAHLDRLEVAYRQFGLASANSLYLARVRTLFPEDKAASCLSSAALAFPYHRWLSRVLHVGAWGRDVWNGLELSGAYHLPQELAEVPLVKRIAIKHLLASPEIANRIRHAEAPLPPALIGYSEHRGHRVPVYLPYSTLFSHKFLVARSRYGKSTLMQLLLWAAMQRVRDGSLQPGIFCIDPHRDLIEDVLALVALLPPERARQLLLLDMTDTDFPVALNPLDASMGFSRDQAVANLMSCFERIWSDFWGPRMAYFLRAVCMLLFTLNQRLVAQGRAEEQFTLLDINPLLQYESYARRVLGQLDMSETWHQELLAWWQNTYFTLPKTSSFRQEIIMPILSKIGVFSDNQQLRRIFGQPVTRAPIHEAVTDGKIVLCALSSRDMDDAAVNILGSTLINLLRRSFRLQETVPATSRRKVFLAVDEFQAFSGADIGHLLSEDAKFGCAALLATQFLKQLDEFRKGLLDTVLGNCENLCAFNVSASDARILEDELQKKVSQKHIISQPRLHCYARLALQGEPLQIVSVALAAPRSWQRTPEQESRIQAIRERNRRRFRPVAEVDELHRAHLKQFLEIRVFANKNAREVRAMDANQQQQEQADALDQQMRADAQTRTSTNGQKSTAPASSPDGQAGGRATNGADADANGAGAGSSCANNTSHGATSPPQASNATPGSGATQSQGGGRRSKRGRSRRLGKLRKNSVGVPPPQPDGVDNSMPVIEVDAESRPLLRASGGGREYGGRERERS